MRSSLGRFHRPFARVREEQLLLLNDLGDGSTLSLDFTTGVLDPRLTFTRSTNATFINSSGLVQYADANLILQSESLATTPWTKQATTPAVQVADVSITNPIGGSTASEITSGGANGAVLQGPSVASAIPHTIRFWIRAGTSTRLEVGYFSGGFQTGTATVVSGGTATIVGSSLFLISNLTSTWTQIQIVLSAPASGGSLLFYPDTAGSPVAGRTLFIWGVQMNAGTTASPYYRTTTTTYQGPRFDHDPTAIGTPRGLLIEGSASNLLFWSQDVTQATKWTVQGSPSSYASISATGGTAPDGTNTANLCTEGTGSFSRSIYQSINPAAGTYTASIWAKAGSGSARFLRLVISSAAGNFVYVTVSLANGSITQAATAVGTASAASATVTAYTGSWYKITLTGTLAAALNFVFIVPTDSGTASVNTADYGRYTYTGDGSSFLIWGAQIESGSGASSYIPTGASTGSRAFDSCVMEDITSCNYSTKTGTLFYAGRFTQMNAASFPNRFGFTRETGDLRAFYALSTTTALLPGYSNGATSVLTTQNITLNSELKLAISFDADLSTAEVKSSLNGAAIVQSGASALTESNAPTYFMLGQKGYGAFFPHGTVRSVKYWPTALPNAQLQALTT